MSSASKIIQAAAGAGAGEALYVEEVFSTYLYTGTGSSRSITNNIDLSGEGGLVWIKKRDNVYNHLLFDTVRGTNNWIRSDSVSAQETGYTDLLTAFNSNGFTLGNDSSLGAVNSSITGEKEYASWTFRKAPKFFDVVTYTGDGTAGLEINHNLETSPGFILIKRTDSAENWFCWHRNDGTTNQAFTGFSINLTNAVVNTAGSQDIATDTIFKPGQIYEANYSQNANIQNATFVAYLFAHNDGDGEFGESGDQDIIKCGSYTGTGSSGNQVNLGFEPQFVMVKGASTTSNWGIFDTMRGFTANAEDQQALFANDSSDELSNGKLSVNATGFALEEFNFNSSSETYIYIAIRRGPMKTPESGTEVFAIDQADNNGSSTNPEFVAGFPVDHAIVKGTGGSGSYFASRLIAPGWGDATTTDAFTTTGSQAFDFQDGWYENALNSTFYSWMFRRAPGFFDVVAYTGDGSTDGSHQINHNLNVAPEMIIYKPRDLAAYWFVWHSGLGQDGLDRYYSMLLNSNGAKGLYTVASNSLLINPQGTDSYFPVGGSNTNASSYNYIAYLFATLPGVSKVGSYTGNGTSQTIDCGFSAGARFVMTRRTNTTGNWNVWDSERGIVAGNDPRLELNTTDAEDTGHDYIDPDSSGFVVNYVADDDDDTNVSGDEYIFLAIA